MPQRLNIPQFNARSQEYKRAQKARYLVARQRKLAEQDKALAEERHSVVGYMRTIQADRRDADIMLRYARATAREASRSTNN